MIIIDEARPGDKLPDKVWKVSYPSDGTTLLYKRSIYLYYPYRIYQMLIMWGQQSSVLHFREIRVFCLDNFIQTSDCRIETPYCLTPSIYKYLMNTIGDYCRIRLHQHHLISPFKKLMSRTTYKVREILPDEYILIALTPIEQLYLLEDIEVD